MKVNKHIFSTLLLTHHPPVQTVTKKLQDELKKQENVHRFIYVYDACWGRKPCGIDTIHTIHV